MSTELPREILPEYGLPKSRVGKDFFPPRRRISGHPAGLPRCQGVVVLTDGFEYLIHTADNRWILVHTEWFIEDKAPRTTGGKIRGTRAEKKPVALVDIEDLL